MGRLLHQLNLPPFRCPACRSNRITFEETGLSCSECDWQAKFEYGVIDMLPPLGTAQKDSFQKDIECSIRGVVAALGMLDTDLNRAGVASAFAPVTPTRHPFFDAEEELFIERFGISNFEAKLKLGPLYLPSSVKMGAVFHGAVRVRNVGAFNISSTGEKPLWLSYHWLENGKVVEFEGVRSAFPVDLAPGREVTTPIEIRAPQKSGNYELEVLPLQEFVRWHDEAAIQQSISINLDGRPFSPDNSGGKEFSERFDGQLGSEFVDRYVRLNDSGVVIEIGGGIRPSFRDSQLGSNWKGFFINTDVSMRLLRIAEYIAAERGEVASWHARLDANSLPCPDNSVDAIFFSRSIHHFENLNRIFNEIFRVLKQNGQLVLLCEPVGVAYDDFTKRLIINGVNEQVFPRGIYERCAFESGLDLIVGQCDWGFSFKGLFRKR
jgi:SAM-dependent methyltransferase